MTTTINTQVTNPSDSFIEKLRFLHKQSLANLRMIEISEDEIERNSWVSEYTENQIELMNLQQVPSQIELMILQQVNLALC
jgi:hypothetical protein